MLLYNNVVYLSIKNRGELNNYFLQYLLDRLQVPLGYTTRITLIPCSFENPKYYSYLLPLLMLIVYNLSSQWAGSGPSSQCSLRYVIKLPAELYCREVSSMTKLIIETDDAWAREKIKFAIDTEIHLLRKTVEKIDRKIKDFEAKYGSLDRKNLYGTVDDMILVEWEGEAESLRRVQSRLKSLEEISFEYR
jgi:hypothetical protein